MFKNRGRQIVSFLIGGHFVIALLTMGMGWHDLGGQEIFQFILSIPVWLFFGWLGFLAADTIHETKVMVREKAAEAKQRYEQLPELGKARVDAQDAKLAKYGGVAAAGVFTLMVAAINPWLLGSAWIAAKAAKRNWKEQNETIESYEGKVKGVRS